MMRSSVYHALEKLDKLERDIDRYSDKAWDKAQQGNTKSSDYYDKKADLTKAEQDGMRECLKTLGFRVWKDNEGHFHIPLDDIETIC